MTKKAWKVAFVTGQTAREAFFLQGGQLSGNSMSLKGRVMSAGLTSRRGFLGVAGGALAAALAVPFAQAQDKTVAGKPAPPVSPVIGNGEEVIPAITRQAGNFSEQNKAVGIAVARGKKEDADLTGERIGSVLSQTLMKKFQIPSKYFVRESAGDYSNVVYFVKGHLYGPYDLDGSVEALALISLKFDLEYGFPGEKMPNVAGKPAAGHD